MLRRNLRGEKVNAWKIPPLGRENISYRASWFSGDLWNFRNAWSSSFPFIPRPSFFPNIQPSSGSFQQNLYYIFSQFDNELRKDKSVTGMKERLRQGYWLYKPVIGYSNSKKGMTCDGISMPSPTTTFSTHTTPRYQLPKDLWWAHSPGCLPPNRILGRKSSQP